MRTRFEVTRTVCREMAVREQETALRQIRNEVSFSHATRLEKRYMLDILNTLVGHVIILRERENTARRMASFIKESQDRLIANSDRDSISMEGEK